MQIIEFANCPETGLQYGFQKSPSKGERCDLNPTVIAIGGPLDEDSVPAILRWGAPLLVSFSCLFPLRSSFD